MNKVFSYYTNYTKHIPEYENWIEGNKKDSSVTSDFITNEKSLSLKQKAQTLAAPILVCDSYEHEKAEDAETFFQTLNIELMSAAGAITILPSAITKLIPVLQKFAKNENFAQKAVNMLNAYQNKSVKIASLNIPVSKALTAVSTVFGMVFFASGIKKSMESQLGLIRKASFDATQEIINDPKLFAILTKEQEAEVNNSVLKQNNEDSNAFLDTLRNKVNLSSTFSSVKEYQTNLNDYKVKKDKYFESLNNSKSIKPGSEQINNAQEDQVLFNSLLSNVEHSVLEPLRRVETISNIAYSSLFTGGFLEYLLTDKLVQVLGIKNKALAGVIKFGAPLMTYLLLNKNISDIENKAILATKYKHLKQFTENPMQYQSNTESEKQSLPQFIKTVYNDMKEYDKFEKEELPELKQKLEAKKNINLSAEQIKSAKRLQKNTSMVINKHREEVYNQTVGIKAFSESILGPIDIVATAFGALIGNGLSKLIPGVKNTRLFTGIGAAMAFVPAAIVEAKLTKQQKLAEKIAAMKTIKNLQDANMFLGDENSPYYNLKMPSNHSKIFTDFDL